VESYRIPWGIDGCPLCRLYNKNECKGCCICEDTGIDSCDNTPYFKYSLELDESTVVTENLIQTVKDELNYLEDLYKRLFGE